MFFLFLLGITRSVRRRRPGVINLLPLYGRLFFFFQNSSPPPFFLFHGDLLAGRFLAPPTARFCMEPNGEAPDSSVPVLRRCRLMNQFSSPENFLMGAPVPPPPTFVCHVGRRKPCHRLDFFLGDRITFLVRLHSRGHTPPSSRYVVGLGEVVSL